MDMNQKWTPFAVCAEYDAFGAGRLVSAHNALHARLADERAKDGRWLHAVRILAALAEQKYTELGTVNEDIQYSVDAIVVRERERDAKVAALLAEVARLREAVPIPRPGEGTDWRAVADYALGMAQGLALGCNVTSAEVQDEYDAAVARHTKGGTDA